MAKEEVDVLRTKALMEDMADALEFAAETERARGTKMNARYYQKLVDQYKALKKQWAATSKEET